MSAPLTETRLDAIEASLAPCVCGGRVTAQCSVCNRRVCSSYACSAPAEPCCEGARWESVHDARTDVPDLVAEVRRLRAKDIERCRLLAARFDEIRRLEAIIAGRAEPPTDAEIDAREEAGPC